ncbi:DNA ligase [Sulfurifustis variabilis]|uniref:DNA ligase (ATP) n=1 Tax=Sulfurifustis variabilis TaxID=1675686 RepID=A0A1B4V6W0_9GAMM|nr:DNA ligase D [Sulfurifustis variabilis]BAU48322.1 DNA ligase [Sulfurifustis variabilis]
MKLDVYRRKRNFERTPEPSGGRAVSRRRFRYVIQKHGARRLHYDLRLELNGTLKSWAVPRGPSLDPREKRLAVHVEDHPIEYGKFEGVIPRKQYGAGPVLVWDRGVWKPEGDPEEGYRRGRLRFELEGEKLRGGFSLVRSGSPGDKENWLLIKRDDEFASSIEITDAMPYSVQTGRTLEDVAEQRARPRASPAPPRRFAPELATLVERPPSGPEWLHEIKYDGYRVLCRLEDGRARLYSRNGNDLTKRMAAIARAIERLPGLADGWLDGEVVALSADGRTSFPALQSALSDGRDQDLIYYLFDLPWWNGRDLRGEPLTARKQRLATLLSAHSGGTQLRVSDHVRGKGDVFYQQACAFGLEGVVSKRIDAPYRNGRTTDWLKAKCRLRQEFVVGGYTDPAGGRAGLGALLLGLYESDAGLRYCGRVGTGFDDRTLRELRARFGELETKEPPFASPLPREARKGAHWVRPQTVVDVEFAGWTHEGYVRQASYQGVREDKRPRDVVRELPQALAPSGPPPANGRRVRITNADKVLYPEQGVTKEELALYYEAVGEWMLPHVVRRPLTLLRCPEGPHKQCFWQKHATRGMPEELRRVPIAEHGGKDVETYLAVDSLQGVLALVQMGVLEIHVWGSRIDRPDQPDRLIFDIDPDPSLGWDAVLEAVALVYARVLDLGLAGFVRTTGGKGLHVVVPIARRHDWDEAKAFSKALADDIVRRNPGRYTSRLALSARKQKVFIDYLRNARGATAVTNYSTRAKPHAPVAVPLAWEELDSELRSDRYNVRNVYERLRALKRDPWEDFDAARRAITARMKREMGML